MIINPGWILDERPATGGRLADFLFIVVAGTAALVAIILWFDNAQGGLTGNGVFNSFQLKPWVVDPANAPLYPSNYLYYPVYGALCRLLDLLGIFAGDPRRQITILNAVSASFCAGAVYFLARSLTQSRPVALLAALFHLACNFVLLLAIINEDIMPSYTLMFASMALAAVWFPRPDAARVVAVSALFTLGWLFEWRLMFPTLPAMLAALWLCERRLAFRFGWIAVFLATVFAITAAVALFWQGHLKSVGTFDLIYTGKGVGTAWAGFTWPKVFYMWEGIVGYLLGAGVAHVPAIPGWDIWRFSATIWMAAVAAVALPMLWRARHDPRARAIAAVFGGTFVAGEVFNLYSQPHDPQMQINVMAWLTVGWAFALVAASRRWPRRGLAALAGLTVALAAYNVWSLVPLRGADGAWAQAVRRIEKQADPADTVFLLHGFDWITVYKSLHWSNEPEGIDDLGPAPQANPKFKWIAFVGGTMQHPDWIPERQAAILRGQIVRAMELGYTVMASEIWAWETARFAGLGGTIADAARIAAPRDMLHADFTGELAFTDPVAGPYYRLQRRPGR